MRIAQKILLMAAKLLLLFAAFLLLLLSVYGVQGAQQRLLKYNDANTEHIFLRVTDVYDKDGHESLRTFFGSENALGRMKAFNRDMSETGNWLEYDKQSLVVRNGDFQYEERFREDFGSAYYGENDAYGISLLSAQMNFAMFQRLGLSESISEGRGFEREDFLYDGESTVPILIGADYAGINALGGRFTLEFLQTPITCEVVGFLRENTYAAWSGKEIRLDDKILFPFFDTEEGAVFSDPDFERILYSLKNWGYLETENGADILPLREIVDETARKYDLKYVLNAAEADQTQDVSASLNVQKQLALALAVSLTALALAAVCALFFLEYRRDRRGIALRLLCGASLRRVRNAYSLQIAAVFAAAGGLAYMVSGRMLERELYYIAEKMAFDAACGVVWAVLLGAMAGIILALRRKIGCDDVLRGLNGGGKR